MRNIYLSPDIRPIMSQARHFHKLGQYKRAELCFSEVLKHAPQHVESLAALGNIALHEKDYPRAWAFLSQAHAIQPDNPEVLNTLGVILKEMGEPLQSQPYFDKAVSLNPELVSAHLNRAFLNLLHGNYMEGFREWEWRKKQAEYRKNYDWVNKIELWDGNEFQGKCLLVYGEQNLSEIVQLIRCATLIKPIGGTVVAAVPQALVKLLTNCRGIDKVIDSDTAKNNSGSFDYQISITSLPMVCGLTIDSIPAAMPYLHADYGLKVYWRKRIRSGGALKVGIAVTENFSKGNTGNLTPVFERIASWALSAYDGITLYNLTKENINDTPCFSNIPLRAIHIAKDFSDLSDAAALIANLDLVLSSDNLFIHIAGAMARPGMVLLPHSAHWRWTLDRDYSHWYPTIKVVRANKAGLWGESATEMDTVLKEISRGKSGRIVNTGNKIKQLYEEASGFLADRYLEDAEHLFQRILEFQPNHFDSLSCLGDIFFETGQYAKAIKTFKRLIRKKPESIQLNYKMALSLEKQGDFSRAAQYYQQTLALNTSPQVAVSYARLLDKSGDSGNALLWYQKALELDPENLEALMDMGLYYKRNHLVNEALACFEAIIRFHPNDKKAHWHRGLILLSRGNYQEGFNEYAWGLHLPEVSAIPKWCDNKPFWTGEKYYGKRLLIYSNENIANTILFARYLPLAKTFGGILAVTVEKPLLRLMRQIPGVDQLIEKNNHAPPVCFDLVAPINYLPVLFHYASVNHVTDVHYLRHDTRMETLWMKRMPRQGVKVCVAAGADTSIDYESLCKNLKCAANFHELHIYIAQIDKEENVEIRLLGTEDAPWKMLDYAEAAGFIANLDLLISSDNPLAHLAAAMGRTTWLISDHNPSWVWIKGRKDTPWYPSMLIFEKMERDNSELINELCRCFAIFVDSDKPVVW